MSYRVLSGTLSVIVSTVGGALALSSNRWLGACLGVTVGVFVAVALAVSPRPSASERAFTSQHGWARSKDPDAVAIEALAGRPIAGRGRAAIEGEWRGRRATRFLVSLEEGVNSKEIWIEGVFVDGHMPQVDIMSRGSRRRRYDDDVDSFRRAWIAHSPDAGFAAVLLDDPMRIRLLGAPRPRRAVYFGAGFIGVRYEAASPNLRETPERLDFVSDLADLIPRAAWDYVCARGASAEDSNTPLVGKEEYARSQLGVPPASPVVVSASSASSASFRRVLVAVVAVVSVSALGLWMLTI